MTALSYKLVGLPVLVYEIFFSPLFIWKGKKIFAQKGGTLSKRTKYREYFVKKSCSIDTKRIPKRKNLFVKNSLKGRKFLHSL